MGTKRVLFAEPSGQWPEPTLRVGAALECVRQMRSSINQKAAERYRTFLYWKHLLDSELTALRTGERMRMALSRDWSGLSAYVQNGLLIRQYSVALGAAGLLLRYRFPGASRLFETSAAVILKTWSGGGGC